MKKVSKISLLLLLTISSYVGNLFAQVCSTSSPLPYLETFDAPLQLGSIPPCTEGGSSPQGSWRIVTGGYNGGQCLGAIKDFTTSFRMYAWWFTPGFDLIAGHNYKLSFFVKSGANQPITASDLKWSYGTCQESTCMSTLATSTPQILTWAGPAGQILTVPTSGTYYFGFYFSEKLDVVYGNNPIYIDDVKLEDLAPVPITGGKLTATKNSLNTNLYWQTYTETNNKYFEIEQSINGTTFNSVGTVASKAINGNSSLPINYQFSLANSSAKFYRYKQTDKDGKYTYSNIVTITDTNAEPLLKIISNPVSNALQISIYSNASKSIVLNVVDNAGRTVLRKNLATVTGFNNTTIDISSLSNGRYYLSVLDGTNVQIQKPLGFLKQ